VGRGNSRAIEEWASHTGRIWCIALSPDDQLAASGDVDGKIVIREMKESGGIKHSIDAGSWVTHSASLQTGRSSLAVLPLARTEHVIQVYDVESGELVLGPIKGHEDWVRCVLWSLDGSQLFSASDDHTIRCWDSETGESIGEPWTGHTDTVYSLSLSPDGTN
jgi:WD40 repeat protein